MTGLEILLLIAGVMATTLVVVAMILIAPRGAVTIHPAELDPSEADPVPQARGAERREQVSVRG